MSYYSGEWLTMRYIRVYVTLPIVFVTFIIMQIILLSGGSGKRLWPLSNGTRSKQFLQLLQAPNGEKESMVQRVLRQIGEAIPDASVTVATSNVQRDSIENQLGARVNIVTETLFKKYPTIIDLSNAEFSDVYDIICELGLAKTKTKNIIEMAKTITNVYNLEYPKELEELIKKLKEEHADS